MTVAKFMKIYEGDRFNKKTKQKHLRGDQLNVTVLSRKFSKPSNQTKNNDRFLIYYETVRGHLTL